MQGFWKHPVKPFLLGIWQERSVLAEHMFNTFPYFAIALRAVCCVLSRTLSVVTLIAQLEDVISLSKVSLRKQSKKIKGSPLIWLPPNLRGGRVTFLLTFPSEWWWVYWEVTRLVLQQTFGHLPPPDNTLPILQSTNIACTHPPWPYFPRFPKDPIAAISPLLVTSNLRGFHFW